MKSNNEGIQSDTYTQYIAICDFEQSRYRPGVAPEGSRKLRFPDFITTAQDGVKVVNLRHRPPLPPRKYTWYSFLLEVESNPGP